MVVFPFYEISVSSVHHKLGGRNTSIVKYRLRFEGSAYYGHQDGGYYGQPYRGAYYQRPSYGPAYSNGYSTYYGEPSY